MFLQGSEWAELPGIMIICLYVTGAENEKLEEHWEMSAWDSSGMSSRC